MKTGHWFTLTIVAFLGLMFVIECSLPKKFVWNPTYGEHDYQPFGCAIFDKLVMGAWPKDTCFYSEETFYQFAQDSTQRYAILSISQNLNLGQTDVEALLDLAHRGNKIMLVASSFSKQLSDTLGFNCSHPYFNIKALKEYAANAVRKRDTLYWLGDTARYAPRMFRFYPQMCNGYFHGYDSLATVLAGRDWAEDDYPDEPKGSLHEANSSYGPATALSYRVGEGEIILVSTPLLFTNYGVLDGDNAAYAFRLLSQMHDLPLCRTQAYGLNAQQQQSPFRYFLSQPALRWGLYLTLATLLLFMLFTARRRQRPIPVVVEPQNRALEFTELIGTLYYQKRNHADLVCKQFTYFAEAMRRGAQLDVDDDADDAALSRRIARKTGVDEVAIRRLLDSLRPILRREQSVSEQQMKQYIDLMNELTNHL